MMTRLGTLMFMVFINTCFTFAQSEINYNPIVLTKTLQKAGISDISAIEEIALADNLYAANHTKGKFFLIKESNASNYQYIYVGRVYSCRTVAGSISKELPQEGSSEYFDYFIIFNNNKTVQKVTVFNYRASHGHEITAKGWLKQFIGHDGSKPLQIDKNIDAISGATISVDAITTDVERKTKILKQI